MVRGPNDDDVDDDDCHDDYDDADGNPLFGSTCSHGSASESGDSFSLLSDSDQLCQLIEKNIRS